MKRQEKMDQAAAERAKYAQAKDIRDYTAQEAQRSAENTRAREAAERADRAHWRKLYQDEQNLRVKEGMPGMSDEQFMDSARKAGISMSEVPQKAPKSPGQPDAPANPVDEARRASDPAAAARILVAAAERASGMEYSRENFITDLQQAGIPPETIQQELLPMFEQFSRSKVARQRQLEAKAAEAAERLRFNLSPQGTALKRLGGTGWGRMF